MNFEIIEIVTINEFVDLKLAGDVSHAKLVGEYLRDTYAWKPMNKDMFEQLKVFIDDAGIQIDVIYKNIPYKLLAEYQTELDKAVIKTRDLDPTGDEYMMNREMAWRMEAWEYLNELRYFKDWSTKYKVASDHALEELVDVLHFTLTLYNMGYGGSLAGNSAIELAAAPLDAVIDAFEKLMRLGGFGVDEVVSAYFVKWRENWARLERGY